MKNVDRNIAFRHKKRLPFLKTARLFLRQYTRDSPHFLLLKYPGTPMPEAFEDYFPTET